MPIIEIQALPAADHVDVSAALRAVARAVAAHLGEDPRGTWAIFRPLDPGAYAEGDDAPVEQPAATHPAIVDLFARERDGLPVLMRVVSEAVADAFGLGDGNVLVRFRPARPEHMDGGD